MRSLKMIMNRETQGLAAPTSPADPLNSANAKRLLNVFRNFILSIGSQERSTGFGFAEAIAVILNYARVLKGGKFVIFFHNFVKLTSSLPLLPQSLATKRSQKSTGKRFVRPPRALTLQLSSRRIRRWSFFFLVFLSWSACAKMTSNLLLLRKTSCWTRRSTFCSRLCFTLTLQSLERWQLKLLVFFQGGIWKPSLVCLQKSLQNAKQRKITGCTLVIKRQVMFPFLSFVFF
jgi:hypothetical protein